MEERVIEDYSISVWDVVNGKAAITYAKVSHETVIFLAEKMVCPEEQNLSEFKLELPLGGGCALTTPLDRDRRYTMHVDPD